MAGFPPCARWPCCSWRLRFAARAARLSFAMLLKRAHKNPRVTKVPAEWLALRCTARCMLSGTAVRANFLALCRGILATVRGIRWRWRNPNVSRFCRHSFSRIRLDLIWLFLPFRHWREVTVPSRILPRLLPPFFASDFDSFSPSLRQSAAPLVLPGLPPAARALCFLRPVAPDHGAYYERITQNVFPQRKHPRSRPDGLGRISARAKITATKSCQA